ncbi:Ig-like domain-containing protein [Enterovibrio paralichthyis]|uniref:Ig-like domain-containing protein n=1 Tax=Enterovibrio paralichthyis TaxID=2853805 RepID=UPI001C48D120|nr:Ig-like domain-containing protein [Enterovibrio paralichthyis]MBV7296731.1 Ig-like domain-containing protein [Enterovibrio paralichthyis]
MQWYLSWIPLTSAVVMSGCNETTTQYLSADPAQNTPQLTFISISPSVSTTYTGQTFKATGRYSDGSESDITSLVAWVSSDDTIVTVDNTGNAQLKSAGEVSIQASLGGVTSEGATLSVVGSIVCGHTFGSAYTTALNNNDMTVAGGACIKLAQDANGNWFTSSPSFSVMHALSYYYPDGGGYENGSWGPPGFFFRFNWFESKDWCSRLQEIEFAGRDDWAIPTSAELTGLYSDLGDLYTNYGWPSFYYYNSNSVTGGNIKGVALYDGTSFDFTLNQDNYISCISPPA